MIPLTLGDIAKACGGALVAADAEAVVTRVCLDSRTAGPGDLFVAIVGQTHDAHDHVAAALAAGAVAAVVSRPVPGAHVLVADTIGALGRIARAVLDRLPLCTVVAVTGSSGKTSTKDLIAGVLAAAGPTVSPPGSFNNEIGMPSTVLRADEATRFLVMEMGMRGRGHIAYLCDIAPPHLAVVTNVGSAHLELLGSREAIAAAKGEVVEALPADGVAVLNHDDPLVAAMARLTDARVMTFGESVGSHVRARNVSLDAEARARFDLVRDEQSVPVTLQVHGRHQVSNALAAAAVGLAVGLSLESVAAALSAAQPASRWRMEVARADNGLLVVNDAYNANPESTDAALTSLVAMRPAGGHSWAVLGEMREIGAGSAEAHRRVGERAGELGVDRVVAVGEGARPVVDGALGSLGAAQVTWVSDPDQALEFLRANVAPTDVVLVKASRSIGLERVAIALVGPVAGEDGES